MTSARLSSIACIVTLLLLAPTPSSGSDAATEASLRLVEERLRLWLERGRSYQLEPVLEQLARVLPNHPMLLETRALLALSNGQRELAQDYLKQLQATVPNHAATLRLDELLQLNGQRQEQLAEARLLAIAGRVEEAAALFQQLFPQPPRSPELALEYWQIIARAGEGERALAGLVTLRKQFPEHIPIHLAVISARYSLDQLSSTDLQALTGYSMDSIYGNQALAQWLRMAPQLAPTKDNAMALAQLARVHPRHAEVNRLAADLSRNYAAAQRAERQQAEQLAAEQELQRQAEIAAVQQAQQQALRVDPWQLSEQARRLEAAGDAPAARQLFADLVATDPTTDAWFAYALLMERQDDYAGARELLAQVPREAWSEGMQALDQRAGERLEADAAARLAQQQQPLAPPELASEQTREAELWIGWDHGSRNSTDGISSLTTDTLLLRLTVPMEDDPDGEWFVQIDPIQASAGAADLSNSFWRDRFGTGLVCQQDCPTGLQPEANEQGVAVGIGARSSDWYADIGLSPIGFERNTVVGGLGVTGDLGQFGVGAEIERRVLTSSLLNFASINDPFSDRSWGLVTRNNLGFSASWDQGGGWGWWGNAGMNWYRGHNVANNQQWYAYSGLYSTVYDTEPLSIDVGLTALFWGFDNDQSQSTFGQGGYYSPKRYASLSIPLTFYGRFERWSYRLRASFGKSDTQLADALFFPNNPELQQLAQLLVPQTGLEPVFAGGSGGGFGRSFNANLEYRIDSHWYVGLSAALQRSEFYDPDSFMLYFRYQFGGTSAPPRKPPLPPARYVDEPWF